MFQLCILPISIHAPPRGATSHTPGASARPGIFQFTPLREGRPQKETSQRAVIISIHAPPRGATRPRACRAVRRTISIHAPPRGATFLLSVVRPSSTISIHAPPRGATQHSSWYGYYYAIISIHAPPRGATARTSALQARNAISIHAPPRGATLDMGTFTNAVLISIHAPPRGATVNARHVADGVVISIHAPPRGATIKLPFQKFQRGLFQFTPLREGRPAGIFDATRRPYFNSRPSARGDDGLHTLFERLPDFNSRPSARGDSEKQIKFAADLRFQFTPLREGRPRPSVPHISTMEISIHAPPRGATVRDGTVSGRRDYFNSRPSARGDLTRFAALSRRRDFNSRPSARGDRWSCPSLRAQHNFNSRPSARGDVQVCSVSLSSLISIHAPPRGATNRGERAPSPCNFNSRPSARGDGCAQYWFPVPEVFQFTPLREGRRQPGGKRRNTHDFNSRPSARGDKSPGRTPGGSHISIHAPPRGATRTPRPSPTPFPPFQFTPLREGRPAWSRSKIG